MASKWVERIGLVFILIAFGMIFIPLTIPEVFDLFPNGTFLCFTSGAIGLLIGFVLILLTQSWKPIDGGLEHRMVPRGPEDWGELLYEEEWAVERKLKNPAIFLVLMITTITAGSMLFIAFFGEDHLSLTSGSFILLMILGLAMGVISLLGINRQVRLRPFRIYETGVTRVVAPFDRGHLNIDFLIPIGAITSIDRKPARNGDRDIVIVFNVVGGAKETMRVDPELMGDPDEPLVVLNQLIGERLSTGLKRYIASREG